MNKFSIDIGFTNICDFNCDICINNKLEKKSFDEKNLKYLFAFLKKNTDYINILSFNGVGNFFLYKHYNKVIDSLLRNQSYFYKKIYISTKFNKIDIKKLVVLYKAGILNNISIGLYNLSLLKKLKGFDLLKLLIKIKKYKYILPISIEMAGVSNKKEYLYWKQIGNILGIDICFERLYDWGGDIELEKKDYIIESKGLHCYDNFFIYIDIYGDIYPCVQFSNKGKEYSIGNILDFKDFPLLMIKDIIMKSLNISYCKNCSLKNNCNYYVLKEL